MEKYTTEKMKPKDGEWYVVYCPEYCESEHSIAQWDEQEKYWRSEGFTEVNQYVSAYYPKPLSDW